MYLHNHWMGDVYIALEFDRKRDNQEILHSTSNQWFE